MPADTGRPGYHPSTLLKLYVYGYLNRIQSSRRLERESGRNVELMRLLGQLAPDFKTIADFRKDNAEEIKNTCRTFIDLCRQLNVFTDAVVAIDGSIFKAVNSKKNNYTPAKLKFHIERVERHIDDYLQQMETADEEENQTADDTPIKDKFKKLKQKLDELKTLKNQVKKSPDKQVSLTDPDSMLLKTQGMTREVCYNVQTAVDAQNHLIVTHEVTNTTDQGQLTGMAKQAKEAHQDGQWLHLSLYNFIGKEVVSDGKPLFAQAMKARRRRTGPKYRNLEFSHTLSKGPPFRAEIQAIVNGHS